jgi:hypothetical protein
VNLLQEFESEWETNHINQEQLIQESSPLSNSTTALSNNSNVIDNAVTEPPKVEHPFYVLERDFFPSRLLPVVTKEEVTRYSSSNSAHKNQDDDIEQKQPVTVKKMKHVKFRNCITNIFADFLN